MENGVRQRKARRNYSAGLCIFCTDRKKMMQECKNPIAEGNFKWIFACNCEGTEQLQQGYKVNGRIRMKKSFFLIMLSFLCTAVSGCGAETVKDADVAESSDTLASSEVVMEIDGQPVVKAEYGMILEKYDAGIKGKYTTEEANRKDFWSMEPPEGEKGPLDQIMDYMDLEKQVQAEHAGEFAGTMTDGKVQYGVRSRALEDAYTYAYTDAEFQLKESMKKKYSVTEEELKQIYLADQEQYISEMSVRMLVGEAEGEEAPAREQEAAGHMAEGMTVEQLAGKYPDMTFYELEMSSLNMEEGKSGIYADRWTVASSMQEGEVCQPFPVGKHWLVMRCLNREEQAAEPFEKVKGTLENEVRESLAREELEKKVTEAKIKVREKELKQIALEVLEKE